MYYQLLVQDHLVVKCKNRLDGIVYAIKIIQRATITKKTQISSLKEAHILSTLSNPYIIRYYQTWIEDNFVHIQLEWCNGQNLYQRYIKNEKL